MNSKQIIHSKKSKNIHVIPLELIKNKQFKKIIDLANQKSLLTHRDRYLYGYSLFCTKQYLNALLTLWPLVAKGSNQIQEDCKSIAAHVFQDPNFLSKEQDLSQKNLYSLFIIAQKLMPQSNICITLKKRLFDILWQNGDYEQLARILKLSKKELSGILLENLSKLLFFRSQNRLPSNISGFIGYILTGGACLIIRNSIYHDDLAASIQLLSNEIKCLYKILSAKSQRKLIWDQASFEKFVDYEASILIEILQLQGTCQTLEIVPTPSYIINYDHAKQIEQKLLPWLQTRTKILEAYNINNHNLVIWAFTGNKLSSINSILKSISKNKIDPYLRLALMLRAANINKGSLRWLVEINDFENLEEGSLFKNVAIQTALLIIDTKNILPEFWQILLEFYTVLQDPEIKKILIKKLTNEYKENKKLNLLKLKNIAYRLNEDQFEKEIDNLFVRQQECLKFLSDFHIKGSQEIIKKIKDQIDLRIHLEFIADSCVLVVEKLSKEFFWHIKALVVDKEINKLIKLEGLFNFNCECYECRQRIYKFTIPHIAEKLKLAVVAVPKILTIGNEPPPHYEKPLPRSSILSQKDPFTTLDVSFSDSKQTIMQKVMKLIGEIPDQMAIFRQAQSSLFDPAQRFVHHYFRYLSYEDANDVVEFSQPLIDIPFREQFLNEK